MYSMCYFHKMLRNKRQSKYIPNKKSSRFWNWQTHRVLRYEFFGLEDGEEAIVLL